MATQQLIGLTTAGVEIEAFVGADIGMLPTALRSLPGLALHGHATRWRFDRWYSNTDITKHLSGAASRSAQVRRIGLDVLRRHRERPFDAIYQFSMPELFAFHGMRRQLPPVIVHPEVHAAGELRWHRREQEITRGHESTIRRTAIRSMLRTRSTIQRYDLSHADLVISPSQRFAELVQADCHVDVDRIRIIPNPIDLRRFTPREDGQADALRHVLFVSRIAVRKGVEMIVELSHRIADLSGQVMIDVIGDRSLWSDYRHLLADVHPDTATVIGHVDSDEMARRLQAATAVLQPSRYEPFALTVAEALACGTPAITSDEVGATEQVDPRVGVRFPTGDVAAMERSLRDLLARSDAPALQQLRVLARSEAERLFSPDVVGAQLAAELDRFVRSR